MSVRPIDENLKIHFASSSSSKALEQHTSKAYLVKQTNRANKPNTLILYVFAISCLSSKLYNRNSFPSVSILPFRSNSYFFISTISLQFQKKHLRSFLQSVKRHACEIRIVKNLSIYNIVSARGIFY